ncbi:AbiH family protein [Listeria fleischmannii]|uniref:Bacteriophage abortive infection AbiH n=1 Tax=Listeria fleischmannii subsp. fleischmannii TaxID=1671902 RepID=A0A2X3HLI3_9LIST|nr:AbiH family protein [Listeria fleischmannii]EMG27701.1 hypothetical protein LFLEISCH_09629 [Listeria fleischmannii subsp. fleischmannii LU2006-1]SQC72014.1 Uncharacterised protein [Listeria fleischmannii subsp. fleischmannii]
MNITFLIGNGFDIEIGLKTKFSDFYKQLRDEKRKRNHIYKEITENPDKWSDFEVALGNYTKKTRPIGLNIYKKGMTKYV